MATGLGIDVGSESIKIVRARVSGNAVTVTGALKIPRAAPVLDVPEEISAVQFVPDTLGAELRRAGLGTAGTIGLSGREVVLKYLTTPPVTPAKLKMFMDMEIGGKLTGRSGEAPAVTYDYRILNTPTGLQGDVVILAGLCKNEYLFGVYSALKKAGLGVKKLTPSSFGLVNAYLRTQKLPPNETVVLVDVGHELLELAIVQEENVLFARSAPGGGKKFTLALDKLLNLGLAKAMEFKHVRARIYPEGAQIANKQELAFQAALKEGADGIASAIRSAVMFCRTQAKLQKLDYSRVFICGGGARLKGLCEYLEKKVGRPVQVLDLYAGLDLRKLDAASARCFEGDIPDMATALGLAIVDADSKAFSLQLTPERIVRRREFWRKTVFGIAAGLVFAVGLYPPYQNAGQAQGLVLERRQVIEDRIARAKQERENFIRRVATNKRLVENVEYYARQTRMGRIYRDLFNRILEVVPSGVTLDYLGPQNDNSAAAPGAPESGLGSWDVNDGPVRALTMRGYYDTDTYPGTKFNEMWENVRTQLLAVPGVTQAELESSGTAEPNLRQNAKPFRVSVGLQDCAVPLLKAAAANMATAGRSGTGAASRKGE